MNKSDKNKFWYEAVESGKIASMIKESAVGQIISNSQTLMNMMKPIIAKENDVEHMYGLFLNSKNKIQKVEKLSSGTLTSAAVYPREIIKKILKYKSAALILVHNHPSGDPAPSKEDINITWAMYVACKSVGCILHDHTIIGDDYYSFADKGYIKKFTDKYNQLTQEIF